MKVVLRLFLPFAISSEIGMGLLYLGTVFYPEFVLDYIDSYFISKLAVIMLLEFFMAHSGVFFTVIFSKGKGNPHKLFQVKHRIFIGLFLISIYSLFAIGFAGTYGLGVFLILTLSRTYTLFMNKEIEFATELGKSMARAFFYLMSLMVLLIFDLGFGAYDERLGISHLGGDVNQLTFLNWGAIYFILVGAMSLIVDFFIKPRKIEK